MCKDKLMAGVSSAVGALAVAAFAWTWNANVEIRLLRAEIVQMKADRREDEMQDNHIKNLWRYAGWLHGEIDVLRFKAGLPPAEKPTLD